MIRQTIAIVVFVPDEGERTQFFNYEGQYGAPFVMWLSGVFHSLREKGISVRGWYTADATEFRMLTPKEVSR